MMAPINNKPARGSAMTRVLYCILAAAWLLSGMVPSLAEGYPTRPVRVVVGFPAGGPTDGMALLVVDQKLDFIS